MTWKVERKPPELAGAVLVVVPDWRPTGKARTLKSPAGCVDFRPGHLLGPGRYDSVIIVLGRQALAGMLLGTLEKPSPQFGLPKKTKTCKTGYSHLALPSQGKAILFTIPVASHSRSYVDAASHLSRPPRPPRKGRYQLQSLMQVGVMDGSPQRTRGPYAGCLKC